MAAMAAKAAGYDNSKIFMLEGRDEKVQRRVTLWTRRQLEGSGFIR
jgi:hypothetical protein